MLNYFVRRRISRWLAIASGVLFAGILIACEPQNRTANTPTASPGASPAGSGTQVVLNGAGASFPAPLYQRWFAEYNRVNPNVQISYQSVGSGAGVQQFLAKTVDFGATDAPLTDEERQQFRSQNNNAEPIQVPLTSGAIVFAYNLGDNVQNLRLSREAYCGIVQGTVTNWNDPVIAQANPGVSLPNTPVRFVHRSDGSGTTFIFTNHIEEACPNWQAGAGRSVEWPVGVGAKGNEGITAQVQQTEGAIGYVEYTYARENDLPAAVLQNRAGQYVEATPETAATALEGQEIPADFALEVPDPTAQQAYPIVGLTWVLLYNNYEQAEKGQALQEVIRWALNEGDQYATQLGYVPLNEQVAQRVISTVDQQIAQN